MVNSTTTEAREKIKTGSASSWYYKFFNMGFDKIKCDQILQNKVSHKLL
jgi:hypothetical protein